MGFYFDNDSITPTKPSSGGGGSAIIEELNIIPTTSAQIITTPSGVDGFNPININAVTSSIDSNIIAENIKKDITILNVTGTYEGSGGGGSSGTTDVPLTRFSDDTNTEIGTHYMDFVDGNGQKYKIILLDAKYRKRSTNWCSSSTVVTNLPLYYNLATANVWEAKETATTNTQLILDYCNTNNYGSTSCTHCHSLSFTINGIIYYGQLPNFIQVAYLVKHYKEFDTLDTSASSYSFTNFSIGYNIWSSSQKEASYAWAIMEVCSGSYLAKTSFNNKYITCPVLEIPY